MSQANRLPAGGRIDRASPLAFSFDGRALSGYAGDTLASALLANDIHLVARSFKYHRPRGILSCGAEEPNALVQVGLGARTEPNVRATRLALQEGLIACSQNRWPALGFDLGAVNDRMSRLLPAGFYYKTFMWPPSWWMGYERVLRRMAGLGRAPGEPDPDRYERMHAHCDVLVVGAGPAGLAAALAAARSGARVILADDQHEAGGQLLGERYELDGHPALAWVAHVAAELDALPDVRRLKATTITGYYDHEFLVGCQQLVGPDPGGARQRLWKIRAGSVVLATGGIERPIVFPDNDRPGVMLAAAARTYVNRFGVRPGKRAVLVTVHDDAYRTALDLASAGVEVAAIVDLRAAADGYLPGQARARGIEVLAGHTIIGTRGRTRIREVRVAPVAGTRPVRLLACDLLCMSGGWIPAVQLYSQARGRLRFDQALGAFVPDNANDAWPCAAGTASGALTLRQALVHGFEAGARAARYTGFDVALAPELPRTADPAEAPVEPRRAFAGVVGARAKQFVDFQTDVTLADIHLALREGYEHVEHLKRYTTTGMGTDQGKTSNLNALALLAQLRDVPVAQVGTTTFRPPVVPLSFGAIAGFDSGELFDPLRKTPLHAWHEANGAVFEDVGQWKRPHYYPRGDESMQAALDRECRAARDAVAMLDASTLGKIDVQGPDAAEFLDRVYCNPVASLAVGRCRYGLMLGQDGMVFDDGVIARLAEHHYLLTTTTGGAARVFAWLEEWLQTEWPQLKVYCTSVTEQYVQIALSGPRSLELLAPLTDIKLDTMPFMSVRSGRVAGIPARVFRISFTGALGFEVAVPSDRGYELWTTLAGAGARFGITPYGTEAMHVLRAEKGFIIVGQETDGSVTPLDLGLERMVARNKAFIGKRSLARADTARLGRKELVGLLTEVPHEVLPEGAQLLEEPRTAPPMPMVGHVTSSYFSANCGRSIALALVKGGAARIGETLYVPLDGASVKATVTAPRFLDDAGRPLHG